MVLGVAVATLLVLTVAARGSVAYAAAGVWAMIGIAVTARDNGDDAIVTATLLGTVLLVATTAVINLRGRKAPLPVL